MFRHRMSLSILAMACAALLPAQSKPWPVPKEALARKNPLAATPSPLKEAQEIYAKQCAMCHGEKGDGQGPAAQVMQVPPAKLNDPVMMKEMTDGEIFYKISEGRLPMPGFKTKLSEEDRWKLVNYLRTFSPKTAAKSATSKSAPAKKKS